MRKTGGDEGEAVKLVALTVVRVGRRDEVFDWI